MWTTFNLNTIGMDYRRKTCFLKLNLCLILWTFSLRRVLIKVRKFIKSLFLRFFLRRRSSILKFTQSTIRRKVDWYVLRHIWSYNVSWSLSSGNESFGQVANYFDLTLTFISHDWKFTCQEAPTRGFSHTSFIMITYRFIGNLRLGIWIILDL